MGPDWKDGDIILGNVNTLTEGGTVVTSRIGRNPVKLETFT